MQFLHVSGQPNKTLYINWFHAGLRKYNNLLTEKINRLCNNPLTSNNKRRQYKGGSGTLLSHTQFLQQKFYELRWIIDKQNDVYTLSHNIILAHLADWVGGLPLDARCHRYRGWSGIGPFTAWSSDPDVIMHEDMILYILHGFISRNIYPRLMKNQLQLKKLKFNNLKE